MWRVAVLKIKTQLNSIVLMGFDENVVHETKYIQVDKIETGLSTKDSLKKVLGEKMRVK